MSNLLAMEIAECCCQLLYDPPALGLGESLRGLLFEGAAERDAWEVLHDYVQVVVGFDYVVDFDDVGVVYHLQDLYLPSHCFLAGWLTDLALFVGLDGDFLVGGSVDGDSNRSIGPLSDNLPNNVVFLELGSEIIRDPLRNVLLILHILQG